MECIYLSEGGRGTFHEEQCKRAIMKQSLGNKDRSRCQRIRRTWRLRREVSGRTSLGKDLEDAVVTKVM